MQKGSWPWLVFGLFLPVMGLWYFARVCLPVHLNRLLNYSIRTRMVPLSASAD